jgi:hypothetical protein
MTPKNKFLGDHPFKYAENIQEKKLLKAWNYKRSIINIMD